jgi:anion-transporting  ArsA/GET3 family ATPase
MSDLLDRRLIFVTGKGGVGKTTVAAALGLLAAERGKRALVCEMEPRGDLSSAFECGPTNYTPRAVSPGLSAMSMDTEAALREYLRINVHLPVFGRLTSIAQAFDFVASAAPGVREILTVGKLCYEVRERHYDLVVADATPSGTILGQLSAPLGINELVRRGAIDEQTRWMLEILEDPERTGVVVVATPEEMPVTEGLELIDSLAATRVQLATVIANRVLPELFGRSEEATFASLADDALALATALREPEEVVAGLLDAARLAVRLRRIGAEHLDRLRQGLPAAMPLLLVPFLFGRSHGPRAIHQVAEALAEELGE